jgi:hypothetical protein
MGEIRAMILPYETPSPLHTAGLSIPLDRYIDFLYNSKTFTVTGSIVYGAPSNTTISFAGTFDRQFFSGPQPIDVGDAPAFEAAWAAKQMTAATRRVCYGESGDLFPLRLHNPNEYHSVGGSKVVAGFMNWIGSITTTVTTPGGSSDVTQLRNFCMPCFNYPVEWGDDPTVLSSGVKKAGSSPTANWLIFARGDYACVGGGPEIFYGSMEDFDEGDYEPVTAKLVLDGAEFVFERAGPPSGALTGYSSGTLTLTRASTW